MNAENFISNVLHLEIERPRTRSNESCALARYPDGRITIRIPKRLDLGLPETQRLLWHEAGHFLDEARYIGGRSQITSIIQTGHISDKNRELLKQHREYLQHNRTPVKLDRSVRYNGKKYADINDLLNDSTVPEWAKAKVRKALWTYEFRAADYIAQPIEIFADGFAEYMMNSESMKKRHPDLAGLFEDTYRSSAANALPVVEEEFYPDVSSFLKDNVPQRRSTREIAVKRKKDPSGLGEIR